MSRLRVKANVSGRKPVFRHKENRVYVLKDGKGGINWFRHQAKVLKPYLFPFVKQCKEALPNPRKDIIIIEDRAIAYSLAYSNKLYIS